MKQRPRLSLFTILCAAFVLPLGAGANAADADTPEVQLTELEDRVRIEIGGELFTEWRHGDWMAPYLYPVIGPNGVNLTRHYPMVEDFPNEDHDHPHHRSIRFSHRGVNDYMFWSPQTGKGAGEARIVLDEIIEAKSGATGELILRNQWLGDGEPVLTETVRLRVIPLENREVLMDYDVTLLGESEKGAHFVDEKDGGLSVRVAGTMKVADRKGNKVGGHILTSRGHRDQEAWGKRAEWADYYGKDPEGGLVGIAIFDHPDNLRFPTHWHARTYGLIAANRFGKGFFEAKKGAKKGDGDYTLKKGEELTLRHRFYFHHGTPEDAGVEEQYRAYAEEE